MSCPPRTQLLEAEASLPPHQLQHAHLPRPLPRGQLHVRLSGPRPLLGELTRRRRYILVDEATGSNAVVDPYDPARLGAAAAKEGDRKSVV